MKSQHHAIVQYIAIATFSYLAVVGCASSRGILYECTKKSGGILTEISFLYDVKASEIRNLKVKQSCVKGDTTSRFLPSEIIKVQANGKFYYSDLEGEISSTGVITGEIGAGGVVFICHDGEYSPSVKWIAYPVAGEL